VDHAFAISLQDQVEKYGAYVGIAAFFGLAVLTLLYFAQAREVKRLREWAGGEPERAQESAAAALAQEQSSGGVKAEPIRSPVTQPVAVTPGAQLGSGGPAVAHTGAVSAAGVPSGVVTSATAIPAAATAAGAGSGTGTESTNDHEVADAGETAGESPTEPNVGEVEPGTEADERAEDADVAPAPDADPGLDTTEEPEVAPAEPELRTEEVSVVGPDSSPDSEEASSVPATATAEPAPFAPTPSVNGSLGPHEAPAPATPAQRAAATAMARPASRSYGPAGAGRRPGGPVPTARTRTRSRSGRVTALVVGGALVTLAALVFAGTQLFGNAEDPAPRANVVAADTAPSGPAGDGSESARPSATANRARTQVAVFNGTTTSGLALSMAERLQSRGYPEGARTGNFTPDPAAPDQLRTTSTVYYAEGERPQARDVGRLLAISELKQIDDDLQSLAPQAKVLVIVGADKTR